MHTAIPLTVLATALACSLFTAPAQAQRARTFVASYGNDSNPCTFASPCRTFQVAVNTVALSGEVTAIDSAGFGPINITKSVTITSPDGVEAGIVPNANSPAITINGAVDVYLRGLTIEGNSSGSDGISLNGFAENLSIVHCQIRHFLHDGILLQPTFLLTLSIRDTVVSDNDVNGIDLSPSGNSAGLLANIDHATTNHNGLAGINVNGANSSPPIAFDNLLAITIVNSVASNNGENGFKAHSTPGTMPLLVVIRDSVASSNRVDGVLFDANSNGFAEMAVSHSTAVGNGSHGLENNSASVFQTYNDNAVTLNLLSDTSGNFSQVSFH